MYAYDEQPRPPASRRIVIPEQTGRRFDLGTSRRDDPASDTARFSFAFGVPATDKSVDYVSEDRFGLVQDRDPDGGGGGAVKTDAGAPVKKAAGVDSFTVKWTKNSLSSSTAAMLRLDYAVKFSKDATHDPAVAEFRQNAFHVIEITAGPKKGFKHDNSPLHDDNYSRADDDSGNPLSDVNFTSNDNPGAKPINKDDVIDYTFTAEQMVIDTSDGNKVVAKRGPHTGTIKGKDPRTFGGVPATL